MEETTINRDELYLGIKNTHGKIDPIIGKRIEDGILDFATGTVFSETGDVYASIEGFPSCKLSRILELWGFQEHLTQEELKDLELMLACPTSVQTLNRLATKHMEQEELQKMRDELWMITRVANIAANNQEKVSLPKEEQATLPKAPVKKHIFPSMRNRKRA
ncbi:MAG: hypothetical protein KH135_01140 [Firmicutes bacterium]|nr:hypothetical protein [Bacillota bacterium]